VVLQHTLERSIPEVPMPLVQELVGQLKQFATAFSPESGWYLPATQAAHVAAEFAPVVSENLPVFWEHISHGGAATLQVEYQAIVRLPDWRDITGHDAHVAAALFFVLTNRTLFT